MRQDVRARLEVDTGGLYQAKATATREREEVRDGVVSEQVARDVYGFHGDTLAAPPRGGPAGAE